MKSSLRIQPGLLVLTLALLVNYTFGFDFSEWENEKVFAINKEPGHATLIPFGSEQTAFKGDRAKSIFYSSLNGEWKFKFIDNYGDANSEFYINNFQTDHWKEISVPGSWQTTGI